MTTYAWGGRRRMGLADSVTDSPLAQQAASAGSTVQLVVTAWRGRAEVAVRGPLDAHSAARFVETVEQLVAAGTRSMVVDLGGCEVGDSAGLDALMTAASRLRERRGELVLRSPRSMTLRMLASAGLDDEIPIC